MTESNHIAEAILVATGEMQKKEYAALLGVDPTRISKMLPEKYEAAINRLQAKNKDLQERASESQALASELQGEVKRMQQHIKDVQLIASELQDKITKEQAFSSELQGAIQELQSQNNKLEFNIESLQAEKQNLQFVLSRYQGQPSAIRFLASVDAKATMLFLLAAFEGVGSFHLLLHKGWMLALPVSIALAFALLVFTASGNKFGKWFVILFALAVGGIYFDVLPPSWANGLFAFVPPVIAALIAFSLKTNANEKR